MGKSHTAIVALCVLVGILSGAQAQRPTEYQVKAAFLFNFAKFVEWPDSVFEDARAPIVIGVIGNDPFGADLDQAVKGKIVRDRKLEVRRMPSLEEGETCCHILFISISESKRLKAIFSALRHRNVLTVGDMDGFCRNGGAVGFFLSRNKVRFEINADVVTRSGLKMSSKLLKLARIVTDARSGERD